MIQIQAKHAYKVPAETVFDAFLNVKSMQEFLFRTPNGTVAEASCDGEAGGNFVLVENRNGQLQGHYGTFMEVDRPERLTFVFSVEKDASESDYVEINFENKMGTTEVTLTTEVDDKYADMKTKFTAGWNTILENLDKYLDRAHASANTAIPKDSNGQLLAEGDTVKTIKDLKVKGSSMVVKRGTIVRKVHLIAGNDEEVDCKVDGVALALETQWLVKV